MKIRLLFLFCLLTMLPTENRALSPRAAEKPTFTLTEGGAKVYYSFDHYAENPKMSRSFISGEMLKVASHSKLWKSSAWSISSVANRLTSVLSLHTHSMSTTKKVQEDMKKVSKIKAYELYMQTYWNDIKLIVFCHRGKGKVIEELLIFKFRSNYWSRVMQLTGKIQPEDITNIIKK